MSSEDGRHAEYGSLVVGVLIFVLILLVLYFVSGVPVVFGFLKFTGDVPEPVVKFYAPLDWLYNNNGTVKVTLDAQGKTIGVP